MASEVSPAIALIGTSFDEQHSRRVHPSRPQEPITPRDKAALLADAAARVALVLEEVLVEVRDQPQYVYDPQTIHARRKIALENALLDLLEANTTMSTEALASNLVDVIENIDSHYGPLHVEFRASEQVKLASAPAIVRPLVPKQRNVPGPT